MNQLQGGKLINVIVCSPIPALRAGLSALVSGDPGLSVAAALASLEDLPGALPDGTVVVATHSALPTAENLASANLRTDMALLLIASDLAESAAGLVRDLRGLGLRAWGILSTECTAEALQSAIRAVAEGLVVITPEAAESLQPAAQPMPGDDLPEDEEIPGEHLTEREVDVLRLLAQGLTNKQIALGLHISEHTVKFHVSSIYGKLDASNRTEAVRKGARRGWIPL